MAAARAGSAPRAPTRTVSVAQMQEIDRTAIETFSIPRLLLMEHAGLGLARSVTQLVSRGQSHPIVLCCGPGFNGGDGLCAARHLHAWGHVVHVAVIGTFARLRDEPATYARILRQLEVPLLEVTDVTSAKPLHRWLTSCSVIVDALLGIGIRGPVREPFRRLIERMNHSGKPIVAADIPSGLDGDTGLPQDIAVKATITVTFGLAKQGCVSGQGPAYVGSLVVDPITIPPRLLDAST